MEIQRHDGDFRRLAFGRATITHRTEMYPTGEKLVKAVQNTLWDAWQIGLLKGGNTNYPRLPLLDREPMEPEF
jgi:hypothetical protein